MRGISRVAKRYVKAFFEVGKEQGALPLLAKDMEKIARAFEESKDLKIYFHHPTISNKQKKETLFKIFPDLSDLTKRFIELLASKGRLDVLDEIARGYLQVYKKHLGTVEAEIITATPITTGIEAVVREKIKEITGKDEAVLHNKVDPDIIGGYILQIGDLRIDDSIKGKLQKIKNQLIQ